jgi:ElaB/YqjD/DUF883 family membrane-anchored ribosome-binding protein
MVEQAKAGLSDAASTVQDKAGELKQQSRGKLSQSLDQRTDQAGGQARNVAQAMRQSGTQLRSQDESGGQQLAGLFESAADQIEHLGSYLERTSGDRLLSDAEDFARRRPWAVAGMGLLVGLAASRFLKASSEGRYGVRRRAGTLPLNTRYGAAYGPGPAYGTGAYESGYESGYETGVGEWPSRVYGDGGNGGGVT